MGISYEATVPVKSAQIMRKFSGNWLQCQVPPIKWFWCGSAKKRCERYEALVQLYNTALCHYSVSFPGHCHEIMESTSAWWVQLPQLLGKFLKICCHGLFVCIHPLGNTLYLLFDPCSSTLVTLMHILVKCSKTSPTRYKIACSPSTNFLICCMSLSLRLLSRSVYSNNSKCLHSASTTSWFAVTWIIGIVRSAVKHGKTTGMSLKRKKRTSNLPGWKDFSNRVDKMDYRNIEPLWSGATNFAIRWWPLWTIDAGNWLTHAVNVICAWLSGSTHPSNQNIVVQKHCWHETQENQRMTKHTDTPLALVRSQLIYRHPFLPFCPCREQ